MNPSLSNAYDQLDTPFLLIDKPKMMANIQRVQESIESLGAKLRPHFKTTRTLGVAPYLLPQLDSPVTVSTLAEAEALAILGYTNMIYAVGISLGKLPRVKQLLEKGVRLRVLLDSLEQAAMLNGYCSENQNSMSCLIEVNCDGHRGGLSPNDEKLLEVAQCLHLGAAHFEGVLTHAGESYECSTQEALREAAANEVLVARQVAKQLEQAGVPCPIVSIGSTPTALSYTDLTGITEVRAGVYTLFDLVMAGIGVCQISDIAASVVATVIGHNSEQGWVIVDAGWMALSSDRGTSTQANDCGYGLVTDRNGTLIENVSVVNVNQEHGMLGGINGAAIDFQQFPIGSRLHILPNHACAMTAMHQYYHVFDDASGTYEVWSRIQGW